MATKKIHLFEYLSSESLLQISETLSTLLLWGLFYIILLTILGFAFFPGGELTDAYDFSLMEASLGGLTLGFIFRWSWLFVLVSSTVILQLSREYLRGHIGEKRPSDSSNRLTTSILARRRHYFLVPSFSFNLCPFRGESFWARQTVDSRRHMMHAFIPSDQLEAKLLVQGGL